MLTPPVNSRPVCIICQPASCTAAPPWCTDRTSENLSAICGVPGQDLGDLDPRRPGSSTGLNGPRISAGASGFMSQRSMLLGAPRLKIMMHDAVVVPRLDRPGRLGREHLGQPKPDRPQRADLEEVAPADPAAIRGPTLAGECEHLTTPDRCGRRGSAERTSILPRIPAAGMASDRGVSSRGAASTPRRPNGPLAFTDRSARQRLGLTAKTDTTEASDIHASIRGRYRRRRLTELASIARISRRCDRLNCQFWLHWLRSSCFGSQRGN